MKTTVRTLLSKWYVAKLNMLMPNTTDAANYRMLLIKHQNVIAESTNSGANKKEQGGT